MLPTLPSKHSLVRQEPLPLPLRPSLPPDEIDFAERYAALRRRWYLAVSVATVVFVLIAAATFRQRKIYESTAKIVVAAKKGADVQVGSILSGDLSLKGGDADTQVEIINSPLLIRKAYESLTEADRQRGFASLHPPIWAYGVQVLKDTDVILVTSRSYVPSLAADFANAIAKTYLDADLERGSQATRQGREYVERERQRTKDDLQEATAALAAFKTRTGIVAPTNQIAELTATDAKLRDDLYAASAERTAAQEKLDSLSRQIGATNAKVEFEETVSDNPEYQQVQARVVDLQNQLEQVSATFAPGSPERQTLETQLDQATRRLRTLSRKSVSTASRQRNPLLDQLLVAASQARVDVLVAGAKVSAIDAHASEVRASLKRYPQEERRFADLQQRVDELNKTYDLLSQRYYSLLIEERSQIPNAQIAAAAEAPSMPSSPNVPRNLALGLLMALFCGVSAALFADFLDNKIHRAEDVEKVAGAAILSLIPEVDASNSPDGNLYIGRAEPVHAFLESFRMLRNNVGFMLPDREGEGAMSIAITSSTAGEGKSTAASNLAIAMSMDDKRVLLVDTDLRKPTVHDRMHVSKEHGLTNVIRGTMTLAEAVQGTQWENLQCLACGPLPPDPTEFLNSRRSHEAFAEMAAQYDVLVLDAPPCIGLSDMQVISTLVEGVVMVVALDRTPKMHLTSALRMLHTAGALVLGAAVNRVNPTSQGYYGYYGYYGYGAQEPSDGDRKVYPNRRRRRGTLSRR